MTKGRWLWALVLTLALGLFGAGTAQAQTGVKVLVLKGADDATNNAGVDRHQGARRRPTTSRVDEAAGVADINNAKLAGYQALVFLNVAGDVLDSAGEAALQGFVEDGKGFLGIGSTATVEPGSSFVNGLIGARPSQQPDDAVAARRSSPATACTRPRVTCRCCGTAQRPLVHVADRARPARSTPSRATAA